MKKLGKLFLVILLSLTITTSLPISVFAYEYGTPDLDEMIEVKINGHTKTHSINKANINKVKNSRSSKYRNKSDKQKLKEVFDALEFNINDLQFEEISKELKLSHISDISVETQYLKINSEGESSYISEDQAVKIAEKEESLLASSQEAYSLATTSDTSPTVIESTDAELFADKCLEMQSMRIYTPNYHGTGTTIGRYCFLGSCVWLTTPSPLKRTTNAICFYSSSFEWPNKILNEDEGSNYLSMFSYNEYYYELETYESIIETKRDTDAVVSGEQGVFFTYDLPNNKVLIPVVYGDFSFLVFVVGEVRDYDDSTQKLSVDLKYTFLTNPLSISPSFSWGPFGVSVSKIHGPEDYIHHHQWDYFKDYNA